MHIETTYVPRGYRTKATFKNNAKKNVRAPRYCSALQAASEGYANCS